MNRIEEIADELYSRNQHPQTMMEKAMERVLREFVAEVERETNWHDLEQHVLIRLSDIKKLAEEWTR